MDNSRITITAMMSLLYALFMAAISLAVLLALHATLTIISQYNAVVMLFILLVVLWYCPLFVLLLVDEKAK